MFPELGNCPSLSQYYENSEMNNYQDLSFYQQHETLVPNGTIGNNW